MLYQTPEKQLWNAARDGDVAKATKLLSGKDIDINWANSKEVSV